jgi:hypothetical protein
MWIWWITSGYRMAASMNAPISAVSVGTFWLPGYRGTFCNPTCAQDYAFKVVANCFGLPTLEDMPRTDQEKRNGHLSHRLPWLVQEKER